MREVLLEVSGEGGTLTIHRDHSAPEGQRYEAGLIEFDFSEDNVPPVERQLAQGGTFAEVLECLAAYPWHALHPRQVADEVRPIVEGAVARRAGAAALQIWQARLSEG